MPRFLFYVGRVINGNKQHFFQILIMSSYQREKEKTSKEEGWILWHLTRNIDVLRGQIMVIAVAILEFQMCSVSAIFDRAALSVIKNNFITVEKPLKREEV